MVYHAKQFAKDSLKTASNRAIQKRAKATGDLVGNKIADELHHRIIQKQLQMSIIKKYLDKDIYLQKKYRKLLMIWD